MPETFLTVGIKRFVLGAIDVATEIIFPTQPDRRRVFVRMSLHDGKVAMSGTDGEAINGDYSDIEAGDPERVRPTGRSIFIASPVPDAEVTVRFESDEI